LSLDGLERWVLRSPRLQRFVVARHERAFRALLPELAGVRHVCVVGGGLFPRTLLVLRQLLPEAELTALDCNADNLERARRFLEVPPTPTLPHRGEREDDTPHLNPPPPRGEGATQPSLPTSLLVGEGWGGGIRCIHAWYDPALVSGFDLVVFPLAFRGDRGAVYQDPPAPMVVVHDWLWRRRGTGAVVSPLLLKRLNLVRA
jgi:hypothetical protein